MPCLPEPRSFPKLILGLILGLTFPLATAACGAPITLHAPTCAPSAARTQPAKVDLEPIGVRDGAQESTTVDLAHPAPAEVLTSGMQSELAGRALSGGEPGGYRTRCILQRFALRASVGLAAMNAVATLYVDLRCTIERLADQKEVWRGALAARAMARASGAFASESRLIQRLADRVMSDASRELASDLAVRVLGLEGAPSSRVFGDEAARDDASGVDDTSLGSLALAEAPDRIPPILPSVHDVEPTTRAAAWNAIAMSAGPDTPWYAGLVVLDDEATVRFYQYKALARRASANSLAQLRDAVEREEETWLVELVKDALATGGLALVRRPRG